MKWWRSQQHILKLVENVKNVEFTYFWHKAMVKAFFGDKLKKFFPSLVLSQISLLILLPLFLDFETLIALPATLMIWRQT